MLVTEAVLTTRSMRSMKQAWVEGQEVGLARGVEAGDTRYCWQVPWDAGGWYTPSSARRKCRELRQVKEQTHDLNPKISLPTSTRQCPGLKRLT
jgi:hypothetical protein